MNIRLIQNNVVFFSIFCFSFLYGSNHQLVFENDALTGTDKHYTNGVFYTYLEDDIIFDIPNIIQIDGTKKSTALSFSHLTFTPEDLSKEEAQTDDIPYAGYMNLRYLLFQQRDNNFHELGIGIGVVGKITQSENMQKIYHHITGNREPKGWDNQVGTRLSYDLVYQYAHRCIDKKYDSYHFDMINNIRLDAGTFFTGLAIGTQVRFGNHLQKNFLTSGSFIGGDEATLLNFSSHKGYSWHIAMGISLIGIEYFYLIDGEPSYNPSPMNYASVRHLQFAVQKDNLEVSLKIKSTNMNSYNLLKTTSLTEWGGLFFKWKY